jgi:hypothetical protein
MNELTTARGAGRKRLGKIPTEDAHCQTINSKMGTTQGNACFARTLGLYWIHDEPRMNAILCIRHSVFKNINRLAECRRPLDCMPQRQWIGLAVGPNAQHRIVETIVPTYGTG